MQSSDQTAALLGRLSKKAGVQATIAIDQDTGAILKKTGDVSFSNSAATRLAPAPNASSIEMSEPNTGLEEVQGIEEMAMMVWRFVQAAGGLIQGLDSEVGNIQRRKLRICGTNDMVF